MTVLPDLLIPNLNVVFSGTAVATPSAERGHYYAGPGNKFWKLAGEPPEVVVRSGRPFARNPRHATETSIPERTLMSMCLVYWRAASSPRSSSTSPKAHA